jgi:hypothetical protein
VRPRFHDHARRRHLLKYTLQSAGARWNAIFLDYLTVATQNAVTTPSISQIDADCFLAGWLFRPL